MMFRSRERLPLGPHDAEGEHEDLSTGIKSYTQHFVRLGNKSSLALWLLQMYMCLQVVPQQATHVSQGREYQ